MHRKLLFSVAFATAVAVPGLLAAQEPTIPSQPPVPTEPTQPTPPTIPSEPAPMPTPQEPVVTDSAAGDVDLSESPFAIGDALAADAELSTFAELARAAGLNELLAQAGAVTIFAPSNEAFAKLPAEQVDEIKADSAKARALVLAHVVPGRVTSAEAATLGNTQSVIGSPIAVSSTDGKVTVGDAAVTKADVEAGESVIHVIDAVLLPVESAPAEVPAAPMTPTDSTTPPAPSTSAPATPLPSTPAPSTPPAGTPPAR